MEDFIMTIDLNLAGKETERVPIPEGLYPVKVILNPGGKGADDALTLSKSGNLLYLKLVYQVTRGPHHGAAVYDQINIELVNGGAPWPADDGLQKAVEIGRNRVRSIVEGARAINPDDDSPDAQSKRQIENWHEPDGLEVWARITIKPAQNGYPARNEIKSIAKPGDRDWPKTNKKSSAIVAAREMDDAIPF
jgi:hypothetical protein